MWTYRHMTAISENLMCKRTLMSFRVSGLTNVILSDIRKYNRMLVTKISKALKLLTV